MFCKAYLFIILAGASEKNALDTKTENRASKVCQERYLGCLKKLTRVEETVYMAVCADVATGKEILDNVASGEN